MKLHKLTNHIRLKHVKEKLQPFIERYDEINSLLSSPDIAKDIKK